MDIISTEDEYEAALTEEMGACSHSSLRFVLTAFPWGQGDLADFEGPDPWQKELLLGIDEGLCPLMRQFRLPLPQDMGSVRRSRSH